MSSIEEVPPRYAEYLPLDAIIGAPTNPKKHSDHIGSSIDRFGFNDGPIMDERTMRLVAGHGRLEQLRAMKAQGQEPPEGVVIQEDGSWGVLVQRGWHSRSDAEAEAFLLAHNQLTTAGGWDNPQLADMLEGLREEHGFDLTELGWGEAELEQLIKGNELSLDVDNSGADGFADGDQFADQDALQVVIACPQKVSEDESFRSQLASLCGAWGLTYKIKQAGASS